MNYQHKAVKKANGLYKVVAGMFNATEIINGEIVYFDNMTKEEAEKVAFEKNSFKFIGDED